MAKGKKTSATEGYQQLKADIKSGAFRRMYIFFGEERYLLENYRGQLKKKLTEGPAEDFNYHRFTEETWDVGALGEAVEAIPMMSPTSLIEIIDIDPFSRPEGERQALTELLPGIPDYCTLVWSFDAVEWKPDKRMKKLWAALSSGLQVEFAKQKEAQLIPWIRRHLATAGKTINDEVCRYLILQTGGSMTTLNAEIQKLMAYSDQPEITKFDVDSVVIPVVEAVIFDITRDIGAKNFQGALEKLRDLLRQDAEPIAINAIIGRQLRQLYGAKVLSAHGKGPYDLMRLYGTWESAARELYQQAGRFSMETLRHGMLRSAETDYAMKTSGGQQGQLLELMLLRLAEDCWRER